MTNLIDAIKKAKIKERLHNLYRVLETDNQVYAVMGNPSCDQDSFLGSITLALATNRVPVVNLSRRIFTCKGDLIRLIEDMGISLDDLLFVENTPSSTPTIVLSSTSYNINRFTVTLVDHNQPSINIKVDRIIDHHPILDNSIYTEEVKNNISIELHAGSCCSLIFKEIEQLLKINFIVSKSTDGDDNRSGNGKDNPERAITKVESDQPITDDLNYLILTSIPVLTDTSLLTKRTNPIDTITVDKVLFLFKLDRNDLYSYVKLLKKEKRCEYKVEGSLILLMDYKDFTYNRTGGTSTFGISSVGYKIEEWINRDGISLFKSTLDKFMEEKGLSFLFINSKSKGEREFVFRSRDNKEHKEFIKKVLYGESDANEKKVENGDLLIYAVDDKLSRKLFAPKVYSYLEEHMDEFNG